MQNLRLAAYYLQRLLREQHRASERQSNNYLPINRQSPNISVRLGLRK